MNLFFKLLMIYRIVLTGLIILKMDTKNLIIIRCLPKHREVLTQVDNGTDNFNINIYTRVKQGNEQQAVSEQYSQRAP